MAKARDAIIESSIQILKEYCSKKSPDLIQNENYVYICHLQAKADCSHGEGEEKLKACDVKKKVARLEKQILAYDHNLSLLKKVPLGVVNPPICEIKVKSLPDQFKEASERLKAAPSDNSCTDDKECKLVFYGRGCVGGYDGYFAINQKQQPEEFTRAISHFNTVKEKFEKESKDPIYCPAVMIWYKAFCRSNTCVGTSSYSEL